MISRHSAVERIRLSGLQVAVGTAFVSRAPFCTHRRSLGVLFVNKPCTFSGDAGAEGVATSLLMIPGGRSKSPPTSYAKDYPQVPEGRRARKNGGLKYPKKILRKSLKVYLALVHFFRRVTCSIYCAKLSGATWQNLNCQFSGGTSGYNSSAAYRATGSGLHSHTDAEVPPHSRSTAVPNSQPHQVRTPVKHTVRYTSFPNVSSKSKRSRSRRDEVDAESMSSYPWRHHANRKTWTCTFYRPIESIHPLQCSKRLTPWESHPDFLKPDS